MCCVNLSFAKGLAGRFLGSKRMRIGGVYIILVEKYKGGILVKKGS
jgi:hypothetical protein